MAANLPVTIEFKAQIDPKIGEALKTLKGFVVGLEKDALRTAKAFEGLGAATSANAKGVSSVTSGARKAASETSLLTKGLTDLRSQAGRSGRAFDKAGQDLTRAFAQADKGPAALGKSLSDLRGRLREVGNTAATEFRKMKSEAEGAGKGIKEAGASFADAQELLGRLGGSAVVGTAVKAAFTTAARSAIEFEAELRSLNTITEMSDEALKAYGKNLRTLSLELKTSTGAAENARAAYDVASAGFVDSASNAKVLEATLKAATAGSVDAADAARLISGSLKAYGADAQEAERFTNVFFTTVKSGITTFPELSASLGNVTGIASQAGISIEELGAAVATATSRGIGTSQAIDGLRGAISNLLAPSEQAKKEMKRLGIVVNEQTLKQKGLLNTLKEISAANGGSAESFKLLLGDVQAFGAALALTSDGGKLFAQNLHEMQTNVTALADAVEEKGKSLQASFDQFKVSLEAASGSAGETFLPAGKLLIDTATGVLSAFASLPEPIRSFVTVLGTVGIATGATVTVVKLLTTATQLETIQLGLNTAAKTLNTTVTTANARATVVSTAALVKKNVVLAATTLSSRAASLSVAGLATSLKASALATGLLGGAFAATAGIVAGAAVALYKYTEVTKEQTAASEKLLDIELRMAKGQKNYANLINKTTEELRAQKVAAIDLTDAILANLERQEAAKESGNTALLEKLREENRQLRESRKKIAQDESVDRGQKQAEAKAAAQRSSLDDLKQAEKSQDDARRELLAAELSRIDVLKSKRELSADEEIAALDRVLEKFKLNADERRRIEEQLARLIGQQRAKAEVEAEKETKKRLEDSLKSGTDIPVDITKNQKGTQQAVNAYDAAIKKVEDWQRKNKALIDQFPELGQKAEAALEKLQADRAASETDRLAANFKTLQEKMKLAETEATTLAQKLEVIDKQMASVRSQQQAGAISLQDAERELASLGQERLKIEQTITEQKLRQAGELQALRMESVQQEIEMLELRKEQGFNVENELIAKREELYQFRLEKLDLEYEAERQAADDKLHVDKKYHLERKNLEQKHTLDVAKELKKRLDDARSNQAVPATNNATPPPSSRTAPSSGNASSGLAPSQSIDGPVISGPGMVTTVNAYNSGIRASGYSSREDYFQLRKSRAADEAERRRKLFEAENPQAVLKAQQIDEERARQQAARESVRGFDRIDPSALLGARSKSPGNPLSMAPPDLGKADPSGLIKNANRAGQVDAGPGSTTKETQDSSPKTINDNRQFDVSINVEGGQTAEITPSPALERIIIDTVERQLRITGYYDGGQGPSV